MRIMKILTTILISGVLVACSTMPPPPKVFVGRTPPEATASNWLDCAPNCTVHVDVTEDCKINVTPLVVLSGVAGRRHVIVWVIVPSDFVFSTAAGTPALDPKGSASFFGDPSIGLRGRTMTVEVTVATPRLSHEYGLNIVNKNGTVCPKYDPFVIE